MRILQSAASPFASAVRLLPVAALLALLAAPQAALAHQGDEPQPEAPFSISVNADSAQAVDEIFQAFDSARSPGCAVGVARNGETLVEAAYGMADLEFRVANEPGTIFEAGSVSKQFAAAAVVLLALDGELSLDDDIRDYIPEVPDYGETITIRHLLNHTSGLRDWGSVAGISGWGRSARSHNHDHALEIISRQSALNYPPGERYSYTNSGYNLLAILVDRVSGTSFAEFSRERLFEPLGLEDTQWRDDYRRVVPGRASAYSPSGHGFRINRPIEDVHGNGGLLTTVSDLLRWNEHLRQGTLGQQFMTEMHHRGVLNNGEQIHYASGLQFGSQNGVDRISHTGATSGYRAYLALFPDEALSVAVLCNVTSASPGGLGGGVSAIFLPEPPPEPAEEPADEDEPEGEEEEEEITFDPTPAEMEAYEGFYHSPDAETTVQVVVEEGDLVILRRPSSRFQLSPGDDLDHFGSSLGAIQFIREGGETGPVREFSLSQGRVHDIRFYRVQAEEGAVPGF